MKRIHWMRVVYGLVVAGLIVASFFAGQLVGRAPSAQASSLDPAPNMVSVRHTCFLDQVGVIDNRVHIRCTTAPSGNTNVFYFTYPVTGANANRYLAVALSANALGKRVALDYESSTASNPAGCNFSDCRLFTTLWITP